MMTDILQVIRKNAILAISFAITAVSAIFVPPSAKYLEYIDFHVLIMLFCLMTVIAGFEKTGLFSFLSGRFITSAKSSRTLYILLVFLCFFSSMLITNDVALLAYIPFSIIVLRASGNEKNLVNVLVLQTIAANLGSMLTPVGNPQNLYLYSYFHMNTSVFFTAVLPFTLVSALLLLAASVFLKVCSGVEIRACSAERPEGRKVILYSLLFVLCLLAVFRLFPVYLLLAVVLFLPLMLDRAVFKKVDYSLLAVFTCFFIFVGSMGSINIFREYLETHVRGHELFSAILLSQTISNVPAAVLLSSFTMDFRSLLIGVNIGGLGTIVASLASLITFRIYMKTEGARPVKFIAVFTAYNLIFLLALIGMT